jgi:Xaa-Pro aminopeptidase
LIGMFEREEFDARLARVRAEMAVSDMDLLLADHAEFMQWLTGYTVSETMYRCALVPAVGEPWIVLRALDEGPARAKSWVRTVVGYSDKSDPYAAVAASIRARGYGAARIGFDPRSYGFTVYTQDRLAALLPDVMFVPADGISDRHRAVKSPVEIAVLERAAGIADGVMGKLTMEFHSGMSARHAAAIAAAEAYHLGADPGGPGPIVGGRGHSEFLHAALSDEPLNEGDVLHVELTPCLGNYGARLMRPIVAGEPSSTIRDTAQRLIALQDCQFEAIRPGVAACDVDAVLRSGVVSEGLRETYENVTGYMLGIYGRTPRPSDFSHAFHPNADWRLEAGMVFHMYVSAGGIAFSETVMVGSDGSRRLTQTPRQIFVSKQ